MFAAKIRQRARREQPASPRRSEGSEEGGGHIMLSYEWSVQPVIKRIRNSLVRRGYQVWLDVSQCTALPWLLLPV